MLRFEKKIQIKTDTQGVSTAVWLTWERFWSTRRIFRLFMWTLRSSSSTALSRSSWVVNGITNCQKKRKTVLGPPLFRELPVFSAPYLVVGVVEVHRLTESHLSFCLQVIQHDGSGELQDPAEGSRGQGSDTGRHRSYDSEERPGSLTSSPLWTRTLLWHHSVGRDGTVSLNSDHSKRATSYPANITQHPTWFLGEEALGLPRSGRNMAGRLQRCSSAKSCMIEFSASCSSAWQQLLITF